MPERKKNQIPNTFQILLNVQSAYMNPLGQQKLPSPLSNVSVHAYVCALCCPNINRNGRCDSSFYIK